MDSIKKIDTALSTHAAHIMSKYPITIYVFYALIISCSTSLVQTLIERFKFNGMTFFVGTVLVLILYVLTKVTFIKSSKSSKEIERLKTLRVTDLNCLLVGILCTPFFYHYVPVVSAMICFIVLLISFTGFLYCAEHH